MENVYNLGELVKPLVESPLRKQSTVTEDQCSLKFLLSQYQNSILMEKVSEYTNHKISKNKLKWNFRSLIKKQ